MSSVASIYTDGACSGNGTVRAVGGWAWAYWPGPARGEPAAARAAPLTCPPAATNQRAELTALLEGMRWAVSSGLGKSAVEFYSDSQYSINCASKWGPAWKRKGWKRESGEPLQNLDLIQPLVDLWSGGRWTLNHVRGHRTGSSPEVWGNNWVDQAAVAAGRGEGRCFGAVVPAGELTPTVTADMFYEPDVIEHVAPSASVSGVTRKLVPVSVATRQTDIRLWFGGSS
jgi:ribonuclease HI